VSGPIIYMNVPLYLSEDAEAVLSVFDTALDVLAHDVGMGDTPEARLRRAALGFTQRDIPAERTIAACREVAAGLAHAWRELSSGPDVPPSLMLVLGTLVAMLTDLAGLEVAAHHWVPVLRELAARAPRSDVATATKKLVEALDPIWWELYETSPLFVAVEGSGRV
jgi:hypothetical protein